MKKLRILIAIVLILLLAGSAYFVSQSLYVKGREGIIPMLRKELDLVGEGSAVFSCIGEYNRDREVLLWFTIQKEDTVFYRAVGCRMLKNGGLRIKNIYDPMAYAPDIVHVVWMAEDVFLVNDPECRGVVSRNADGNVTKQIDFAPSQFPVILSLSQLGIDGMMGSATIDFVDSEGNPI